MRMTVRQSHDAPGILLHDAIGTYEDVALFGDGLRQAGYFCNGERFKDKATGYEDWTFRDVTDQGRDAIVVALTWES